MTHFCKPTINGIVSIAIIILVVLTGYNTLQARTISEGEAREIASTFLLQKQIATSTQHMSLVRMAAHTGPGHYAPSASQPLYIYNAGGSNGGYVIVSGDSRAVPVLGYCDHGSYDPTNIPPALQEWIDFLQSEITSLEYDEEDAPSIDYDNTIIEAKASVAPLLTSMWDQNAPYNIKLKKTNNGEQAVTGCVATSMAQIMYYHKWPNKPTSVIPAYTTETQSIYMPELPITTFNWSAMKNTYMGNETGTAANAVATLMLYCAQSLEMDFKDGVSSSYTSKIGEKLSTYFNYSNSARCIYRSYHSASEWETLIYNEVAANRPVAYGGSTMAKSGHSFVCDGYDSSTNMFHFNWGWSGASNGYYMLSALKPKYQGTGSASGTEGYIGSQHVIIGIAPNNGTPTSSNTAMTISKISSTTVNYTRPNSSSSFTNVKFSGRLNNFTGATRSFFGGWALYKNGALVKYLIDNSDSNTYCSYNDLPDGWGGDKNYTVTFDSSIPAGTYQLYPVSQVKNGGQWQLCNGHQVHYIEATVSSYSLSLKVYGTSGTALYSANNITFNGNMRVGKPIEIVANLNNSGTTTNDFIYLIVDGTATTMAIASIEPGTSGNIKFNYLPTSTGSKTVKFALDQEGTKVIATRSITIQNMPSASLTATINVQNSSTVNNERIINGNTFAVQSSIKNNISTAYDEDIVVQLFRITDYRDNTYYGKVMNDITKKYTIAGNTTINQNFAFNNLSVGESYWVRISYYSAGSLVRARDTNVYKIVGGSLKGDIDGNNVIDVEDVNAAINIALKLNSVSDYPGDGDMDGNGIIDVEDVNAIINIILKLS